MFRSKLLIFSLIIVLSSFEWGPLIHVHGTTSKSKSKISYINKEVNVDDFGAKADGTDDTQAFKKAWKIACSANGSVFVVPSNKVYHLKPISFSGPCHTNFTMKIYGTIKASVNMTDYGKNPRHWLVFVRLLRFTVEGGGIINGNGKIWWDNSCKVNTSLPCQDAPTAIIFSQCMYLRVNNLTIQNPQQMHLRFQKSIYVNVTNFLALAPGDSPNTDGLHISETQYIQIINSDFQTGDDCVSIQTGSNNILVANITCGPGHGISVGSLGEGHGVAHVSDIIVDGAIISNTTNGVRIKTWQGGAGSAVNITFQNILMRNVTNPIVIDQNYCDSDKPCSEQYSGVQVNNVAYNNIIGTSASEVAINLDCSKTFPCRRVYLQNINLTREGNKGGDTKASYANVMFSTN